MNSLAIAALAETQLLGQHLLSIERIVLRLEQRAKRLHEGVTIGISISFRICLGRWFGAVGIRRSLHTDADEL